MKKKIALLLIICLSMSLFLVGCGEVPSELESFSDDKKTELIVFGYYNDEQPNAVSNADKLIMELYPDDVEKQEEWKKRIREIDSQYVPETNNEIYLPSQALEIQEGWTWVEEDYYNYVRGRVKNVGNQDISYFEITVEYLDGDLNVLDSDYTNSGQTLKVSDMKEFEIMHRNDISYEKVRVSIGDVRF